MKAFFYCSEGNNVMFYSTFIVLPFVAVVALTLIGASVRIMREYERAVVFTLGRFQKVKGPALCC